MSSILPTTDEIQDYLDHRDCIKDALAIVMEPGNGFRRHEYAPPAAERFMPHSDGSRRSSVVLADETAIELGSPSHLSASCGPGNQMQCLTASGSPAGISEGPDQRQ